MDIEFRHLLYFIAVAEEGSLKGGARRLELSQPGLKRQLDQLESRLGVHLLNRHRTGVSLTQAGQTFLRHARGIVGEHQALLQELRAHASSNLRVGYIAPSLYGPIGEAIALARKISPQTTFQMVEGSPGRQLKMLNQGRLDVAFLGHVEGPLPPLLEAVPLYDIPLAAVVRDDHPWAQKPFLALGELHSQTFLGLEDQLFPGRQALLIGLAEKAGFAMRFAQLADSLISLFTLIGHGQGISLIPLDAATIAHPRVVFIPLQAPMSVCFHAVIRRDCVCPLLESLLDLCRQFGAKS